LSFGLFIPLLIAAKEVNRIYAALIAKVQLSEKEMELGVVNIRFFLAEKA